MRRRRRPVREIAFSFDAFLDVVANVVGIILRLIMVAWVGARSYKAVVSAPPLPPPPALVSPVVAEVPPDPRVPALAARRRESQRQSRSAEEQERRILRAREQEEQLARDLRSLGERRAELASRKDAALTAARRPEELKQTALTLAELEKRSRQLLAEAEKVKKLPPRKKEVRFRTPVSAAVERQTDEVMFELRRGRVTLLETAALLALAKSELRSCEEELRTRWDVWRETPAVGAFRFRFVVERSRSALDGPTPGDSNFRYGLSGWEAVPVGEPRGEPAAAALKGGSAFRKVIDALDAQESVVTLWVYPDSFAEYRLLRDYLHGKAFVVAGRPLPDGSRIASSRHGTASRGQ